MNVVLDFIEKRSCPRLNLRIPISYKRIDSFPQEPKGSLLRNISLGGLSIAAYEFLPHNLKLALDVPLQLGLKPLAAVSRVAWVKKASISDRYQAGIEFVSMDSKDKQQLQTFLNSQDIK